MSVSVHAPVAGFVVVLVVFEEPPPPHATRVAERTIARRAATLFIVSSVLLAEY